MMMHLLVLAVCILRVSSRAHTSTLTYLHCCHAEAFAQLEARMVPRMELSASSCTSADVTQICNIVNAGVGLDAYMKTPCCMSSCSSPPSPPSFVWEGNEDSSANIVRVVAHLEQYILPSGVRAWPAQQHAWLHGAMNCGAAGTLLIKASATDYILVLDPGFKALQRLQASGSNNIADGIIMEVLPWVVGLYEAKTTTRLHSHVGKWKAQALLKFLAADQLRPSPEGKV
jgi:hypothetical protein